MFVELCHKSARTEAKDEKFLAKSLPRTSNSQVYNEKICTATSG